MAELIVTRPFVRVRKYFIRFVQLFEPRFGSRIARIDVRVVFFRQLAKRFFYLFVGSSLFSPNAS